MLSVFFDIRIYPRLWFIMNEKLRCRFINWMHFVSTEIRLDTLFYNLKNFQDQ